MLTRNSSTVAILLVLAGLAGCATSRSEIKLEGPAEKTAGTVISSGQTVVIRSVHDERVFEEAPKDPSTPSLGSGGAAQASAEIKARAVGRKRGGFGKALGDVLLESGQTVEGVIRENLAAALQEAGYAVKAESEAGPSPLVMDVHIKKFWAWFQPGFWAVTLNADIATDLALSGAATSATINVHVEDKMQIATDGDWMKIVGKALEAYRAQTLAKATTFPKTEQGGVKQ